MDHKNVCSILISFPYHTLKQVFNAAYGSPLPASLILMTLFGMICFVPFIYFENDYDKNFFVENPNFMLFFDSSYEMWLTISIFVAIPMVAELILDYSRSQSSHLECNQWISRAVLICALTGPNALLLGLIEVTPGDITEKAYIPQLQLSLFYTQQVFIIGSLFCTMFGHRLESVTNPNDRLTISIEKRTIWFLICFVIGKLILLFGEIFLVVFRPCVVGAIIFITLAVVQIIYILIQTLLFLFRQSHYLQFKSHHQMHDFWQLLAVLCFVVFDFVLLTASQRFQDIIPSQKNPISYNLYIREFLFIQIVLTLLLTVIPSRVYNLSAKISLEKLDTRLNLIRYVSHEMRTPLNTAFLGLSMVSTDLHGLSMRYHDLKGTLKQRIAQNSQITSVVDEEDIDFSISTADDLLDTVKQVHDSCKVALETLNDLLTFDKIDENKLVIEVEEVDPWVLLCDTAKPFEINAKEANVSFQIACVDASSHWTFRRFIKADRFKLSQVVRNLISNSLKFTPPHGNVVVSIQMLPLRETTLAKSSSIASNVSEVVRISVQDNGAGISKENQKKLFGQYVQFNASALQQGKGSGLGLWITRSIVEMHSGRINGTSEGEGKGSTFYLDLPLYSKDSEKKLKSNFSQESLSVGENSKTSQLITENISQSIQKPSPPSRGLSTMFRNIHRRLSVANLLNTQVVFKEIQKLAECNEGEDHDDVHRQPADEPITRGGFTHPVSTMEINKSHSIQLSPLGKSPPQRRGSWFDAAAEAVRLALNGGQQQHSHSNNVINRILPLASNSDSFYLIPQDDKVKLKPGHHNTKQHPADVEFSSSNDFSDIEANDRVTEKRENMIFPQPLLESQSPSFRYGIERYRHEMISIPELDVERNDATSPSDNLLKPQPNSNSKLIRRGSDNNGIITANNTTSESSGRRHSALRGGSNFSIDSQVERFLFSSRSSNADSMDIYESEGLFDGTTNDGNIVPASVSIDALAEQLTSRRASGITPEIIDRSSDNRNVVHTLHCSNAKQNFDELRDEKESHCVVSTDAYPRKLHKQNTGLIEHHSFFPTAQDPQQSSQSRAYNSSQQPNHVDEQSIRAKTNEPGVRKPSVTAKQIAEHAAAITLAVPVSVEPGGTVHNNANSMTIGGESKNLLPPKVNKKNWDTGGLHILLVDDSLANRKMLKKLLTMHKHHVQEAYDGMDCLEKLDYAGEGHNGQAPSLPFPQLDMILMDEHMPRLNGIETIEILRKKGYSGYIFAVTGAVEDHDLERFQRVGVQAVFSKPLNVDALRQTLNELFQLDQQ